ncbi:DUF4397 domain-containing protein [Roseateles sp. BYS96W]|uniref:DUF4397 domain-containing protein n=1 Tax=Pelomonas nitida TaxID=3299027 RepID=A0ABW7G6A1_9BURK
MRFTPLANRLALTLSLSVTAALTACGGGGDDGSNTQMRLLNATRSFATLDLTADDKAVSSKVAYANVGEYGSVGTSAASIKVLDSVSGVSLQALTPQLNANSRYTLVLSGFAGAVRPSLIEENQDAAEANRAKLQVLNLAPDAGALDVYVTAAANCTLSNEAALVTNLAGSTGSIYNVINSGKFRVCVTGYSKRNDLRLEIPEVTLDSTTVNTLILTATDGGVLVNGMTLLHKSTVKNFPTTLTRVRAVSALAGTAPVSATISGNNILPSSLPPNTTDYYSFTAGANSVAITANSIPVGPATYNFLAGNEYTLLVWGDETTQQVSVLVDDNRLPTISGNVKMRLVNGMSAANALASLNVDYQTQASNVLPGTSSVPANMNSSTGAAVTVNSPLKVDAIYNPASGTSTGLTPLTANGVYTVFVMGDPNNVKGKLSKDR